MFGMVYSPAAPRTYSRQRHRPVTRGHASAPPSWCGRPGALVGTKAEREQSECHHNECEVGARARDPSPCAQGLSNCAESTAGAVFADSCSFSIALIPAALTATLGREPRKWGDARRTNSVTFCMTKSAKLRAGSLRTRKNSVRTVRTPSVAYRWDGVRWCTLTACGCDAIQVTLRLAYGGWWEG